MDYGHLRNITKLRGKRKEKKKHRRRPHKPIGRDNRERERDGKTGH
jgi:hypothetical protein